MSGSHRGMVTMVTALLATVIAASITHSGFTVNRSWSYTPTQPYWVVQHYASNDAALFLVVSGASSPNGTIVALDPVHGHTLWETSLDTIGCATYYGDWLTIFADSDSVVVNCATNCNDCAFIGLAPTTGHLRWRTPVFTTSEVFNGVLSDGVFYAPYKASMETSVFGAMRATNGAMLWRLPLTQWPETTLLPNNNVLVLVPPNGNVLAINASNGNSMWNRTRNSFSTLWGVNGLVLLSMPGGLLAVAANTNVTVWELTFNATFYVGQILPVGASMVVVAGASFIVAVAVDSGAASYVIAPSAGGRFTGTAISDGRLLANDNGGGRIVVANASTGALLANISFPCSSEFHGCDFLGQFAAIVRGTVYTAAQTSSGYQFALTAYNATTGVVLGSPVPPVLLNGGYDVQVFGTTVVFIKAYASIVVAVVGK